MNQKCILVKVKSKKKKGAEIKVCDILTKIAGLSLAEQDPLLRAIPQNLRPKSLPGLVKIFQEVGKEFLVVDISGVITQTGGRFPLLALGMPILIIVHSTLLYLYPESIY